MTLRTSWKERDNAYRPRIRARHTDGAAVPRGYLQSLAYAGALAI